MADRRAIPRLMLVTDVHRSRRPLPGLLAEAVAGGVDAIYVRNVGPHPPAPLSQCAGRGGNGRAVWDAQHPESVFVRALATSLNGDVALLISGTAEMAQRLGVGLHLRERDPLPGFDEARRVLGPAALIGRSVHSPEAAAASTGADYLLAGHVYPSASKPGKPPLGVEGLAAIVAAAPCPVLAIGGITAARVGQVIRAGAHGSAVIGAIAEADDPRAAASALRTALEEALQSREKVHFQEESPVPDEKIASNGKPALEIVVNGKTVVVAPGQTVHDFLASRRLADQMAIVERNGEIVPRARYGATELAAGDRLEVVHAVGGG